MGKHLSINDKRIICNILVVISIILIVLVCCTGKSNALTKKVGKVVGGSAYVSNGECYSDPDYTSHLFWIKAKAAKKYEIYKSDSYKGKYKKIKTIKSKNTMKINPSGLTCYKIRGVNGRKKGRFSPILVGYGFDTAIEEVRKVDTYSTIMKVKIDNTASNSRDMIFYNEEDDFWGYSVFGYDNFEKSYEEATGYYSDVNGAYLNPKTIAAGTIGYIYIILDSANAQYYYNEVMNSNGDIELAIDFPFFIRDGKKKIYFDEYSFIRVGHGKLYTDHDYEAGDMD